MSIISFLIAIIASTIGSISGIGGGIIIKPVMDAISGLSPNIINFMSGCTVLSMAVSSYIRNLKSPIKLNYKTTLWLALGACIGGYYGKVLFSAFTGNVKLVQSIILLIINLLVMLYLVKKSSIKTLHTRNFVICTIIGLVLGVSSSFLGIGGGPINIVVLSFFFSMSAKETARNSLFVILFSQFTSLVTTFATHSVPEVDMFTLVIMCIGGVVGSIIGSMIASKMDDKMTDKFFAILLVFLILLNIYNVVVAF